MKQELLQKTQELLQRWVDNIFGDEVDREHFGLSFEVEKKAGAQDYYRYTSTEDYAMRSAIETEGDVCEFVEHDEVAVEAMWNLFVRGREDDGMYVLVAGGRKYHCSCYQELADELLAVFRFVWDLFVPYENGESTEKPDEREAWEDFEACLQPEHHEMFKRLGWKDAPQH